MKRCLSFILMLAIFMCFCGCARGGATVRYFSYLDTPARATLTGSINGLAFAATLECGGRQAKEGYAATAMPEVTLTFTAPAALKGVCVRQSGGKWAASLGEVQGEVDAQGLGQIAAMLLCEQPIQSTRKEQNALVLTLLDGTVLTLDERMGTPLRAVRNDEGRALEVVVVGWE